MLNIYIPKNVIISINENWVELKGPLGVIKKKKSNLIKLIFDEKTRILYLSSDNFKMNHFYLSMLNKLIWGVWKGYTIKLNIIGVGYKVFLEKNILSFKLGFSHNVLYNIPNDIIIKILSPKALTLLVMGKDLQKVNQVASEIKGLKPIEPYKGKGIKYFKDIIKLKQGKKTNV